MKAHWNGRLIADSDDTVEVEGNHYFPRESVVEACLLDSDRESYCPWKGKAAYFDVVVDGEINPAAAWSYPDPMPAAAQIRGRVAFWNGIEVS